MIFFKSYKLFIIFTYLNSETDLQKLLQTCGVMRKDVVFLITDTHIKKDEFLLYVTEILNGDISDFFSNQELEKVCFLFFSYFYVII